MGSNLKAWLHCTRTSVIVIPKGMKCECFNSMFNSKEEKRLLLRLLITEFKDIGSFHPTGNRSFNASHNRLIFNRLAPYGSWEDFIAEARSAWEFYRNAFSEAQVVRIGVRYINRIVIPMIDGKADLEDYLTINLPGPIDHGLTYTNFLEHSQFQDPKTGLGINWVFALQPSNESSKLPLVLDIGVHAVGNQAKENNPIQMWETMRELKNRLFFGSFTDKGKALFK